jgi:hypothetical protein
MYYLLLPMWTVATVTKAVRKYGGGGFESDANPRQQSDFNCTSKILFLSSSVNSSSKFCLVYIVILRIKAVIFWAKNGHFAYTFFIPLFTDIQFISYFVALTISSVRDNTSCFNIIISHRIRYY